MVRGIALVTGASRGIGKASALALARRGFDVAITARTVSEGERFDYGATRAESGLKSLPGSLERTAADIEALNQRALPVRLDLLDRESVDAALDRIYAEWGRVDVLVNNAIYQGPGTMDPFLDLTPDILQNLVQGNFIAQIQITQRVLAAILANGEERDAPGGAIVNLTSNAARNDPPGPAGQGGWGYGYGGSKAAFHRMVGVLHAEHRDSAVRFYNLDPGYVVTEIVRSLANAGADLDANYAGVTPEVPAAAIAWLAQGGPEADALSGRTLAAARLCRDFALLEETSS